ALEAEIGRDARPRITAVAKHLFGLSRIVSHTVDAETSPPKAAVVENICELRIFDRVVSGTAHGPDLERVIELEIHAHEEIDPVRLRRRPGRDVHGRAEVAVAC